MLLRPRGLLLCSTPNLYRLRNVVYLLRGRPLFDHFDLPGERGYGHVLEYSAEHLAWQFQRAGFTDCAIELRTFTHTPNEVLDRVLFLDRRSVCAGSPAIGSNLLAVAINPPGR